jgi:hypothetical protein
VRSRTRRDGRTRRDEARVGQCLADLVVAHVVAVAVRLEHVGDRGPLRVAKGSAVGAFDEQARPEPGRLQEHVE